MCRLFALFSAPARTRATFWLLDAPDSIREQSHRDPDGTGLGHFAADGTPHVHRAPVAASADRTFAAQARGVTSTAFVAHVRYASTGALTEANTHPFVQDGRIFAHNGVIEGLDALDAELGPDLARVAGDTDSERFFALISRETARHRGDVSAGITSAARWTARHLPVFSLNLVLAAPDGLWALRYPDTHGLYVLHRAPGGHRGGRHLDHRGTGGRIRVHSEDLATAPATVVASEPLDDDPGWHPLRSGTLLHVPAGGPPATHDVLDAPPAHLLTLADLRPEAAASQTVA